MCQLVDDCVGQIDRVALEGRIQQRIVEESQRAERIRGPDVDVEAIIVEILGCFLCRIEIEVALVWHSADDREPPRIRFQRVAIGRRNNED